MGYTEQGLPFQSTSQASYRGAVHAALMRGVKTQRLLDAYADAGTRGLTDAEASHATGLPVQSVCSLRNGLMNCAVVRRAGDRLGPWGVMVGFYVGVAK